MPAPSAQKQPSAALLIRCRLTTQTHRIVDTSIDESDPKAKGRRVTRAWGAQSTATQAFPHLRTLSRGTGRRQEQSELVGSSGEAAGSTSHRHHDVVRPQSAPTVGPSSVPASAFRHCKRFSVIMPSLGMRKPPPSLPMQDPATRLSSEITATTRTHPPNVGDWYGRVTPIDRQLYEHGMTRPLCTQLATAFREAFGTSIARALATRQHWRDGLIVEPTFHIDVYMRSFVDHINEYIAQMAMFAKSVKGFVLAPIGVQNFCRRSTNFAIFALLYRDVILDSEIYITPPKFAELSPHYVVFSKYLHTMVLGCHFGLRMLLDAACFMRSIELNEHENALLAVSLLTWPRSSGSFPPVAQAVIANGEPMPEPSAWTQMELLNRVMREALDSLIAARDDADVRLERVKHLFDRQLFKAEVASRLFFHTVPLGFRDTGEFMHDRLLARNERVSVDPQLATWMSSGWRI